MAIWIHEYGAVSSPLQSFGSGYYQSWSSTDADANTLEDILECCQTNQEFVQALLGFEMEDRKNIAAISRLSADNNKRILNLYSAIRDLQQTILRSKVGK